MIWLRLAKSIVANAKQIRKDAAIAIADHTLVPWYESATGQTCGNSVHVLRHEVARKTYESLASTVWRPREEDFTGAIEFLVSAVEAEPLEDGDYLLVVTVLPRNVDYEDEDYDLSELKPMPLYTFLEAFVPTSRLTEADYDS